MAKDVPKFQNFFWRLALLYLQLQRVDGTLDTTAGSGSPVRELGSPPKDIEHVAEPLQLPSLHISSAVPAESPPHAESNGVVIECPVPQPIIDEHPLSDCCTSSTHQVDEGVVIVYQDDVTGLDRANACTAGPSMKSISSVITQPSKHSSSSGIDIGLHVGSVISDDLKMELLDSAWAPSADCVMPHSTRTVNGKEEKRYLRHEHLKRCPFLSYSPSMQGLYCRPCVLFGPPSGEAGRGNQKLSALVIKPLTKYHRLFGNGGNVSTHENTEYHKTAVVQAAEFRHKMKSGMDILKHIDQSRNDEAVHNRSILMQIIKTVLFCGRHNLPLRGDRDDGPLKVGSDGQFQTDFNEGNFRALLSFRVDSGDKILEAHLKSASRTATYISKTTQNELISCIGQHMVQSLVQRVRCTRFFSVLADETTDAGRKEQLSISLRFVEEGKLHEEFLCFTEVTDLTGRGLGFTIMDEMRTRDLDLENLVGQGYDGASAMSGAFNGAHAVICSEYPLATYVHCSNHVLNLCLSHGSREQAVRNAMGILSSAANFFSHSSKRTALLETIVTNQTPDSNKKRLLQLCETRWVERHDAVLTFVELFSPLVTCLTTCLDLDKDTATSAQMILNSISRPEFIVATSVMHEVLAVTKPLSVQLQKVGIDLIKAMSLVDETIACLEDKRSDDASFLTVWEVAESLASVAGVDLKQPRQVARQRNRVNVESCSDQEYFKRAIYYPFLDHILSELRSRFNKHSRIIAHLWSLIPRFISSYSFSDLQPALDMYGQFLESEQAVKGEYDLWKKRWTKQAELPDTAVETLVVCDTDFFPNLSVLLHIAATLPVTSASAERSFSALKRLKSYCRTTMGQERLNGLAQMHIQYSVPVDIEAVINLFATSGSRKALKHHIVVVHAMPLMRYTNCIDDQFHYNRVF